MGKKTAKQLERHFKKRHHCTPHDWLIQTRLRHAAELLLLGWINKEVAAAVGLGSCSALCHFFKKVARLTPLEYVAATKDELLRDHSTLPSQSVNSRCDLTHFES